MSIVSSSLLDMEVEVDNNRADTNTKVNLDQNCTTNGDHESKRDKSRESESEKGLEEEEERETLSTRTWMEKNEYNSRKLLNKVSGWAYSNHHDLHNGKQAVNIFLSFLSWAANPFLFLSYLLLTSITFSLWISYGKQELHPPHFP